MWESVRSCELCGVKYSICTHTHTHTYNGNIHVCNIFPHNSSAVPQGEIKREWDRTTETETGGYQQADRRTYSQRLAFNNSIIGLLQFHLVILSTVSRSPHGHLWETITQFLSFSTALLSLWGHWLDLADFLMLQSYLHCPTDHSGRTFQHVLHVLEIKRNSPFLV